MTNDPLVVDRRTMSPANDNPAVEIIIEPGRPSPVKKGQANAQAQWTV